MVKDKLEIYNLQFPDYVNELTIGDYVFTRVNDYEKAFGGMMKLHNSKGGEFNVNIQAGSHQITATVKMPIKEKFCVLPFENKNLTQLEDILLLFSIFTGRNVFKKDWENTNDLALISDHRKFNFGGQLMCSVKYESMWKNKNTGKLKTEDEMKNIPTFDWDLIDIGFEKTLNKVFELISSESWQEEYFKGYFLFLYKDAIQRQILEKSFLTCWTIWEQIFSIKNNNWLHDKDIFKMGGDKKIAYILEKYFYKKINEKAWVNIARLTKSRNRLVHFGKKMDNVTSEEKNMFIRLTEQLVAIILELKPSNVFNSFEKLDAFLNSSAKTKTPV